MQILAISFPFPLLDSTPCPLSPSFSRNVTTCSLHNAYLLSPIDAVGRVHFEKGDVCKFESDSTLSREVDRLRNYCSDTRRTILADDDASMFHAESQALTYPFRDLNYL